MSIGFSVGPASAPLHYVKINYQCGEITGVFLEAMFRHAGSQKVNNCTSVKVDGVECSTGATAKQVEAAFKRVQKAIVEKKGTCNLLGKALVIETGLL